MTTKNTARALDKYGVKACRVAYHMHANIGFGASGIAFEGPLELKTTRQADAAINAGRELAEMDHAVWC
ncbi:hypothetical protein [Cupriavidus sp. UYPR2.512]|uniref:hypothetical protein n=1 Tax=Cupriavidus sp. UYPR2.512 TaxID=1080187 RepID=UPI000379C7A9|nr:hypothetical protein [Cupriavidus sp. UYPR2.512]UIF89283.1 hypothetical protein KAF44_30395 [Cupriavidus necator]